MNVEYYIELINRIKLMPLNDKINKKKEFQKIEALLI